MESLDFKRLTSWDKTVWGVKEINRTCFTESVDSALRQMEQSGLVNRKVYAEVPPKVEYSLTDVGYSLKPILDAMWTWGEEYQKEMEKLIPGGFENRSGDYEDIHIMYCVL